MQHRFQNKTSKQDCVNHSLTHLFSLHILDDLLVFLVMLHLLWTSLLTMSNVGTKLNFTRIRAHTHTHTQKQTRQVSSTAQTIMSCELTYNLNLVDIGRGPHKGGIVCGSALWIICAWQCQLQRHNFSLVRMCLLQGTGQEACVTWSLSLSPLSKYILLLFLFSIQFSFTYQNWPTKLLFFCGPNCANPVCLCAVIWIF
jgi:hypothetical protein